MHGFALLFAWHLAAGPSADPWFAADKAKHFFSAAFVESVAFSGFRAVGLRRNPALGGAAGVAGLVSVGKEVYDARYGGDPSLKDLTWDGAGMVAAGIVLRHTRP